MTADKNKDSKPVAGAPEEAWLCPGSDNWRWPEASSLPWLDRRCGTDVRYIRADLADAAEIERLREEIHNYDRHNDVLQQQADKAEAERDTALARVAELEADRRMIVSHATMGTTDGVGLSVNDISVKITALRNELYAEAKASAALTPNTTQEEG